MRAIVLKSAALVIGALVTLGPGVPRLKRLFTPQQQQPQQAQSVDALGDLRKEIEARNAVMTDGLRRGDLLGVARVYEDDGQIRGPQIRVKGRAAIDEYYTGIKGAKDWKLEVQEVGGTRESAWEIGRSTLAQVNGDGQWHKSAVDFVMIWKRDPAGQLRVHLEIYNFAY
ncbi:MAG: hypothetical protein ABJD07_13370 [Gemmatimonadaceae bacterium]